MRLAALLLASLSLCPCLAFPAAAADASATLPERKAGLWELKTIMDEGNGPRDQTMKLCVDQSMEKNTVLASIADHKANCASYDIKAAGGATVIDATCMYNGRQVISTTNMSGDFKSAFAIKIESATSDPEQKTQTVVVKRTITQEGKFVADSCGDLKPGEAQAPDGTKVLVQ